MFGQVQIFAQFQGVNLVSVYHFDGLLLWNSAEVTIPFQHQQQVQSRSSDASKMLNNSLRDRCTKGDPLFLCPSGVDFGEGVLRRLREVLRASLYDRQNDYPGSFLPKQTKAMPGVLSRDRANLPGFETLIRLTEVVVCAVLECPLALLIPLKCFACCHIHENDAVVTRPNQIGRFSRFSRAQPPQLWGEDERGSHQASAKYLHEVFLSALRIVCHRF